jgi:integrase/recombinase XerD
MKERSLMPQTVAITTYRIAGFYQFCVKEGILLCDPTKNLFPIKEIRLLKDVPDEKAISILLACPDEYTHLGIRDKAILELMYSSGLRKMEVHNLKVQDVDLKEAVVRIRHSKGGRERMLPMGQKAAGLIQKYLQSTRPKYLRDPKVDHLFLSNTGNPIPEGAIHYIILRYKKRSPVLKNITPHSLRHACALHMLRGGAPIQAVQEMLGHKRLETTQVYTKLYPKDLKEVHQKFHPRENDKKV